jgi:hypothetical protein
LTVERGMRSGRVYLTGDRIRGQYSDRYCSYHKVKKNVRTGRISEAALPAGDEVEEKPHRRTRDLLRPRIHRRPNRRPPQPAAGGAPATASPHRPPRTSSSAGPPPPPAFPLSPATTSFFSGVDAPPPPPLSSYARRRLAPGSPSPSPPRPAAAPARGPAGKAIASWLSFFSTGSLCGGFSVDEREKGIDPLVCS